MVVGIATRNPLWEKMLSNISEVRSRGATVVPLADDGDEESAVAADHVLWGTVDLAAPLARGGCGAAAAVGLPPGPPARPRSRPPPEPGEDGDLVQRSSGVGVDAVDAARFWKALQPCRSSRPRNFSDAERLDDLSVVLDVAQSLAAGFAAEEGGHEGAAASAASP